jgi:hypothetical protein
MKWTRAVHHLESLAAACDDLAPRPVSMFPLRVTALWAVGDLLGSPRDLDFLTVALCVDLPVDEVAWWCEPPGARHWAEATRLSKNPVLVWWRSAHAPVWNHRIDRPVLAWDQVDGVAHDALAALREGRGDSFRQAAPNADDLRARLDDELQASLTALRACTDAYDARRFRPGKLGPVAEDLWRASDGYLDVLRAMRGG